MPKLFTEETKRVSIAVPKALAEAAEARAMSDRRTVSHLYTIALEGYLNNKQGFATSGGKEDEGVRYIPIEPIRLNESD